VKQCTPGVFRYDEESQQVILVDAKKANNIDEIKRIGNVVSKKYGFSECIVHVDFVPDRFNFTVEVRRGRRQGPTHGVISELTPPPAAPHYAPPTRRLVHCSPQIFLILRSRNSSQNSEKIWKLSVLLIRGEGASRGS
jgi:hypothetical protein